MSETKRMPIEDFRKLGFLQEANRQFFHPLGLALEVVVGEDGEQRLGGIWDYRGEDQGIVFEDLTDADSHAKAVVVALERLRRAGLRVRMFGDVVQPIGSRVVDAAGRPGEG